MMPSSTTPAVGEATHQEQGHGYGLVLFASILLIVVGCFNVIQGIAAIANSRVFTANVNYVFANLHAWGWITLILGGTPQLQTPSDPPPGSSQFRAGFGT